MATRYWRGGAGTWNTSTTTNWSTTSGGGGGASVPTTADDVIIDANSGTGTITCTNGVCANLTVTASQSLALSGTALDVYGDISFPAGGSFTANLLTLLSLRSTTTGRTITSNGKTFPTLTISCAGTGGYTLTDAIVIAGTFTLYGAAFNTNNFNVTAQRFVYTDGLTSSLTLGSSTFLLNNTFDSDFITPFGTDLTINAGTSTISLAGTSANFSCAFAVFNFYNIAYTNLSTSGGGATLNIGEAGSINNLTLSGPASSGVGALNIFRIPPINGTLQTTGTTNLRRVAIAAANEGIQKTITAAAVSLSDVDFRDIAGAGAAAPFTGTRLGDRKGNSGITFDAPQTYYWNLGGSVNWTSGGWATSSGGSPVAGLIPLAQDNAVFDNAGAAGTVSYPTTYAVGTLNLSARTNSMTLSINNSCLIYGDLLFGTGVTVGGSQSLVMAGRNTQTITSNGRSISPNLGTSSLGGTVVLADNFSTSNSINLSYGTFNANNRNVTANNFTTGFSNLAKTVTMGSGTWTLTGIGTVWSAATNGSALTVNANTSTILLSNTTTSARTFAGADKTYNNLTIGGATGISTLTITGVNTFGTIASTKTVAHTITLAANQTVANWTASGSLGNLLTLNSSVNGTQRTLTKTGGGTIEVSYLSIRDSNAAPTSTWIANNSTNVSNNTGWIFATPVTVSVTGVQGTGQIGTVTFELSANLFVSGLIGTTTLGTVGTIAGTGVTVALSGVQGDVLLDSVILEVQGIIFPIGVHASAVLGSVTAPITALVYPTGVQATGFVGSVEIIPPSFRGVRGTGVMGVVAVWITISTSGTPDWQQINTVQT